MLGTVLGGSFQTCNDCKGPEKGSLSALFTGPLPSLWAILCLPPGSTIVHTVIADGQLEETGRLNVPAD